MRDARSTIAPARLALAIAMLAMAILAMPGAAAAQTTAVGLSTVRSQRFGNDNLSGIFIPAATDLFAYTLAGGDFNGDGADDLATGMPYDNGPVGGSSGDSGSVVIRYSSPGGGLTDNPSQVYVRQTPDRDPPESGDRFGWSLASCDFDGDSFDDLAVGVAYEDYAGEEDAGAVQVHYGSSGGLHTSGDEFFTESTNGITGDVEAHDRFGYALACGDFNGDDFADLAVGVPFESDFDAIFGCVPSCDVPFFGMVVVVPGSPDGLAFTLASHLDQGVSGMGGDPELGDLLGWTIAAGDFDADTFDDLAIGVPGEDDQRGSIRVVFGGPSGLVPAGSLFWSESFIGGLSEDGDSFGNALAAGDVDGDGHDDLAIGIPYENFAAAQNCGQVNVLFGSLDGFDRSRTQFWAEENIFGLGAGGANPSESDDALGYSLVLGDFDQDGHADLAVGHPAESFTGPQDGAVTILMGSAQRLSTARKRRIVAGFEGFAGDPNQHAEYFGFSLAGGDFDGDGHADLVIGAPYENQAGMLDVGAETVLYGALFADGVESGGTTLWSQTVSSPYTSFNNLRVSTAAKLGPASSKLGVQVNLFSPTLQKPGTSTFVRVGPEAGFANERTLSGTFFVDPQSLTMSPNAGKNVFSMMTFTDGVGTGSRTRLTFDLNRNDSVGGWAILANSFNEATNSLQFAGGAGFALANPGDPSTHNNRIDWSWRAGNPGHLTMWRTRYQNGVPDGSGKLLLFDVDLPGATNAVVNHVFAGMVAGQDSGTFGALYLDELSFRR